MKVAVPLEMSPLECRVAATPKTVKRLVELGFDVNVEMGAGLKSDISDDEYGSAGACLVSGNDVFADADVILVVGRPSSKVASAKNGAILIGSLDPYGDQDGLKSLAKTGLSCFSVELLPRITRVQSMDVLSSQSGVAGYRAVIEAVYKYGKTIPMMITPAGTLPAAKVFVMGVGVAGLQAIATARRLGALVTATDVRPAAKEQVVSLGARFIAIENDEFKQSETAGGYAKAMSESYKAAQAELVAEHIKKQDIVITAALIPGRPAPRLVSYEMLKSMNSGAIVFDLAIERGGNVEGAISGSVVNVGGVKVVAYNNIASRIPASASLLYANNLIVFLETLIDKESKKIFIDWQDELVMATAIARDGKLLESVVRA